MNRQKVLDRIKKLLAILEPSSNASQTERETAQRSIESFKVKFKLSDEDISSAYITHREIMFPGELYLDAHIFFGQIQELATILIQYFGLGVALIGTKENRVTSYKMYGPKDRLDKVEEFVMENLNNIKMLEQQFWDTCLHKVKKEEHIIQQSTANTGYSNIGFYTSMPIIMTRQVPYLQGVERDSDFWRKRYSFIILGCISKLILTLKDNLSQGRHSYSSKEQEEAEIGIAKEQFEKSMNMDKFDETIGPEPIIDQDLPPVHPDSESSNSSSPEPTTPDDFNLLGVDQQEMQILHRIGLMEYNPKFEATKNLEYSDG